MDRRGARIAYDGEHLLEPVAASHDESASERGERTVQVAERVEEERDAVRRAGRRRQDLVVEHEEGHDVIRLGDGRRECGLVGDAEVAGEDDDRGGHAAGGSPASIVHARSAMPASASSCARSRRRNG